METRAHVVVIASLLIYTVVMTFIVMQNNHLIDTFRTCSDTSGPMLLLLRDLMDRTKVENVCAAIETSAFARMRIVVLTPEGKPIVDSIGFQDGEEGYEHITEAARSCDADAAPTVIRTSVDGKHVALHACKTKAGVTIAVQTEM